MGHADDRVSETGGLSMNWLGNPFFYGWFQRAITRGRCSEILIRRYIRPVAGERLLDLGCGIGKILDHLPPVDYWGLDLNQNYIRFADKNFGHRAKFICADLCDIPWPLQGFFDRVLAVGILHHLTDEQARLVLGHVRQRMKPRAKLITLDGCYEKGQSPIARMLLSMDRGRHVRTQEGYEALARSAFPQIRTQMERGFLRVPYSHVVMEMTADA
jgi:SAM-dependent methyltransferase